jgi:pre-mRNA-splicing factor 38B
MCGSVRGVGAGGIISTPFCILFKLFTLRLTRKQVNGLIRHKDSPYIRALGFMYIRFTQPPQHLWQWFEPFLDDEEEVDPKAGGGQPITIGQMSRHMLTKLDWFSTLFPRVPVPIQKDIESKLKKRDAKVEEQMRAERGIEDGEVEDEEEDDNRERRSGARFKHDRRRSNSRERRRSRDKKRSRSLEKRSHSRDDKSSRSDDKHRYRRSRSPHSPHSHRYSRGDNREREHHRHRHRY